MMKATYRFIVLLAATLLFVGFIPHARAGLFGPSNTQECIEKYVPKANTTIATVRIRQACDRLFQDLSSFVREKYPATKGMSDKNAFKYVSQQEYQKLSNDELNSELDRRLKNSKKKAKCILELDALVEAKNNMAASLVLRNSECSKSTYRLQAPSGRIFEVIAPEGSTDGDVWEYAQQQLGQDLINANSIKDGRTDTPAGDAKIPAELRGGKE